MDRKKELLEAKTAALSLIRKLDEAISQLRGALSWGVYDIIGGGMLSSMIKRNKIKEANEAIRDIRYLISSLNKELQDVDLYLPDELRDSFSDNLMDTFFDNIFTDFRVQGEVKHALNKLIEFRASVSAILSKIEYEIEEN